MRDLAPGASVQFDADLIAYPRPFSALPPGDYEVRAVLDTDHSYQLLRPHPPPGLDQSGGEPDAVEPAKPGGDPHPERTYCANPQRQAALAHAMQQVKPGEIERQEMVSPLLTHFSGNSTSIRAWVILPPGYAGNRHRRYPTAYFTHGFGANNGLQPGDGRNDS